ncbi:hypothetical protein RI532_05185 [Levilactobacillus namurensis]|uniref:Electron transfer flavoprotein small subunit n=1 Tax=Levilactobacillus namurensis TaxID=380393 RepID=A0AAW8W6D7_9LACO|nr:hypothetical protein [Levilactobacillus namurensis]MDT7013821.1 hypothetical protein [Levilactobacillus namurensis]
MKIVVCIKQVPETNDVTIDPKTHNLDRRGLAGVMNPFDKNAVEQALQFKATTDAQVVLLSMGPDDYAQSLREGMAMGADSGVLLSDRAFAGADTLATGYVIAKAIEKLVTWTWSSSVVRPSMPIPAKWAPSSLNSCNNLRLLTQPRYG